MRAVFTKQHLAFQDRCIESPDMGFAARSYILTPLRKVLRLLSVACLPRLLNNATEC